MAWWSCSGARKGRCCQARSATQGECSKTQPSAAVKEGWSSWFSASSVIADRFASDADVRDALGAGQSEEYGEHTIEAFRALEGAFDDAAFGRTQVDVIGRLAWSEIAGFAFELESLGTGTGCEVEQMRRFEEHFIGGEPLERIGLKRFFENAEAGAS